MSGRKGQRWRHPGPRSAPANPKPVEDNEYRKGYIAGYAAGRRPPGQPAGPEADPADGARVKRCGACGKPDPGVIRGPWNGIPNLWFPACAECIARFNGPLRLDTDPLHVPEVA